MAKYHGKIGYNIYVETSPGVYTDNITEREYYGDVNSRRRTLITGPSINDNISINSTEISIVADPFARDNFINILYIEWMNQKWKVKDASVKYPRLILMLGDIYNG